MAEESIKKIQLTTMGIPVDGTAESSSTIEAQEIKVNPFEASAEQVLKTLNASKSASVNLFGTNPIQNKDADLQLEKQQLEQQNTTSFGNIALNGYQSFVGGLKNLYNAVNKYNNAIDGKMAADNLLPAYVKLEPAFASNERAIYLTKYIHNLYYGEGV